ncbi:MAG: hypothetical protein RL154_591 [Pseudomonadota bacterium]|jgi:CRP/FNR family transcriptional regulator
MELLNKISYFSCLDDVNLKKLEKVCKTKQYAKEQIIFFEGETPTKLFIIVNGKVAVYKTRNNGDKIILNIFSDGEMFAEAPCFNNFAYPASSKCLQDSNILEIDYASFQNILSTNQDMSLQIIAGLGLKVRKLSNFIASYDKTAIQRVAEYLIKNNSDIIKHKDIAERLNMRPETFSRTISKLIQKGAIIDNTVNRDELYKLL